MPLEHIPFPSLLAILVAICSLFVITGAWLYVLLARSSTKQISLSGFGISVVVDTRLTGRRKTDVQPTSNAGE